MLLLHTPIAIAVTIPIASTSIGVVVTLVHEAAGRGVLLLQLRRVVAMVAVVAVVLARVVPSLLLLLRLLLRLVLFDRPSNDVLLRFRSPSPSARSVSHRTKLVDAGVVYRLAPIILRGEHALELGATRGT